MRRSFFTATGLSYCWNRYYAPALGRFLARDIYPGETSDPVTMNPYLYCGGDPVIAVDPTGMVFVELWRGVSTVARGGTEMTESVFICGGVLLGVGASAVAGMQLVVTMKRVAGLRDCRDRADQARRWINLSTITVLVTFGAFEAWLGAMMLTRGAGRGLWLLAVLAFLAAGAYPLPRQQLKLYAKLLLGVDIECPGE